MSPLELGLIELPTRPRSVYTMGQRKAAIEACEGGILREAADLTLAAITESGYCRGILADLAQGIVGLPRIFVGDTEMIAALSDTTSRVGELREMLPEPDLVRLLSWGITLGVAPGQMRRKYGARPSYDYPISVEEAADWKNVRKLVGAPLQRPVGANDNRILRAWSPKWLRCQWWEDSSWYLMTADGEIRISHLGDPPSANDNGEPIPVGNRDEWLLYTPYGKSKPWEWGTWKSATLAFVAERDATFDRLRHAEVLAPARVGQVPAGTTETQRKKYLRLLAEAKRMALYVLPPGLDYKIVESTGRVADIYKAIIEWSERQYAMQSGALTTATGSAGFSKGDVQERFTRAILSAIASTFCTTAHEYALVPWAIDNYGSEDAPRTSIDTKAPEDKKALAETLSIAGKGLTDLAEGLDRHGFSVTKQSVERYAQSLGFEVEQLPVKTNKPRIDVTPSAREYAYTLGEVRAGDGYDPLPDDRNDLTIAEAEQLAKKKAADAPAPTMDAQPAPADEDGGEPPTDESAAALAVAMTHHGIARCEHGACNKCRKCGVERLRGFDVDPTVPGQAKWKIAWQPIVRAKPVAAPGYANGAGAPGVPAWSSQGGDA